MIHDAPTERLARHEAALAKLLNIPLVRRDDVMASSIVYHRDCVRHLRKALGLPPAKTAKTT